MQDGTTFLSDALLQGFSEATRDAAQRQLNSGMSVYGYIDGKPMWVNPDGTITETPKSCIIADPEE